LARKYQKASKWYPDASVIEFLRSVKHHLLDCADWSKKQLRANVAFAGQASAALERLRERRHGHPLSQAYTSAGLPSIKQIVIVMPWNVDAEDDDDDDQDDQDGTDDQEKQQGKQAPEQGDEQGELEHERQYEEAQEAREVEAEMGT
jgi:hypothetical protein